jgi:hypothetical protein
MKVRQVRGGKFTVQHTKRECEKKRNNKKKNNKIFHLSHVSLPKEDLGMFLIKNLCGIILLFLFFY